MNRERISEKERAGTALVVVLVVIVLLSLGAYTFSELMVTEYRAANTYAKGVQAEQWAASGVEYVAALMTPDGGGWEMNLFDNAAAFHVQLGESGGFSVVAPIEDSGYASSNSQATSGGLRLGLIDECSRLNVNVLATFDPEDGPVAREMLVYLPNMTEQMADSILDWIDSDDEVREYGGESTDYSVVLPRNGAIDSLEELLFVNGMTPELLYGEDANRNGILDPNENDGAERAPFDNADGVLDLGWSEYLTVYSLESNLRHNLDRFGEERINVNESLLTDLYDAIIEETGDTEIAQFICGVRMTPAPDEDSENSDTTQALNNLASGIATLFAAQGNGSITRDGLDLSAGSKREIKSLYELIDVEVTVTIDGKEATLTSPWTSDAGDLQQTLPLLLDTYTTIDETVVKGRVNINQARREVMLGIPDMPADLPDSIIATRASRVPSDDPLDIYRTTGWLLIQGLTDLETMRKIDGYITTRGEVFRMQVVGHSDQGGPITRIEAVVDASETIPRIVFYRNLSQLGPGYRRGQLPTFAAQ